MKSFLFAVALLATCNTIYACDMCGGSGGSQYIGLLPAFSRNFAGIQYLRTDMSGSFASAYQGRPNEETHDVYNTLQAWGRHRIGKYQIFAFIPWQYNVRAQAGERNATSGIGDITLLLNRVVLSRTEGKNTHTLFGGAGVRLPTGKYTSWTATDGVQMQSMSPGTGSVGATVNGNYTLQHGNSGLNADVSYLVSATSPDKYRYGSRLDAGAALFYTITHGKLRILPQAGTRCEYAGEDYYNYSRGWRNTSSGGIMLFAAAGAQLTYDNLGIRLTAQLPLHADYAGGELNPNYKTEAGFFILF